MKVISLFLISIFLCSGVFAVSGVSPKSYDIDFESGFSEDFVFNFVVDGSEDLYIDGELADYVSLDKKSISGSEKVIASLDLPRELDSPGINYIAVGVGEVKGFIKVHVPYPQRYVEVGLNAPNVNAGDDLVFELELFGRGNDSVLVSPRIEIFRDGEALDVVNFEEVEVPRETKMVINKSFSTEGYSIGDYLAVAYLDYDGRNISVENPFEVGDFLIKLVDYTKSFRQYKIDRFDIYVESLYDASIQDVYVEVNVLDYPEASFVTSPEKLLAWESRVFSSFLDTSLIGKNNFRAEIVLHYDGETTSEVVNLEIIEGFDYVLLIIILIVLVIFALLIWRSIIFIKRFDKQKKKKK